MSMLFGFRQMRRLLAFLAICALTSVANVNAQQAAPESQQAVCERNDDLLPRLTEAGETIKQRKTEAEQSRIEHARQLETRAAEIQALAAQLAREQAARSSAETRVAELNPQLEARVAENQALAARLADEQTACDAIEARVDALNAQLEARIAETQALTARVDALNAQLGRRITEIQTLAARLAAEQRARIDDRRARDQAQAEAEQLRARLEELGFTAEPTFTYAPSIADSYATEYDVRDILSNQRLTEDQCGTAMEWLEAQQADQRALGLKLWVWRGDRLMLCRKGRRGVEIIAPSRGTQAHVVRYR